MEGLTLMVVDDEAIIRNSVIDFFEDRQWITLQAESGETALELLGKHNPDAILVDVRMGGMDGNTFIREAYEKAENSYFFICTGSPEYEIPEDLKGYTRVADKPLKKPIHDLAALEHEILNLLNL